MINQVIQGDCLEVMKGIPSGSIDCVITDLPYGTTACKWDTIIPFDRMWEHLKRITKPNGAIVLFGCEPFSSVLRISNIDMYKYDWIWEKTSVTGFLNSKRQPLRANENISVFYKTQPQYNPQKTFGHSRKVVSIEHGKDSKKTESYSSYGRTSYDSTERYPRNVIKFATDKQKSVYHPTQKPVALIEYLIKTYSNEGETVLDFTAGSGTTGVACRNLNRNFILIEKEERFIEICRERLR